LTPACAYEPAGAVLRTWQFYALVALFVGSAQAGLLVIANAAPLLNKTASGIAFFAANAWLLAAYGGVVNASGRVGTGTYSDGIGRVNAFGINGLAAAACLFALPAVMTAGNVWLLFVLVGVVYWQYGGTLALMPAWTADFYGAKNLGLNYGLVFLGWGVAFFIPQLAAGIKDATGSLDAAFYLSGGAGAGGGGGEPARPEVTWPAGGVDTRTPARVCPPGTPESCMDRATAQKRIAEITWYHEFDFGDGLTAGPPRGSDADGHRAVWAFIRSQLDRIDFRGKTVLDIGCWDGYWSFEAERRGAKHVLATDDVTQNWAGKTGVGLAKELLRSNVEVDLARSVYDLRALGRTFDVVLFLGVYYHLHAPLEAFAQVRHCCHPGTVVAVDGPVTHGLPDRGAWFDFTDRSCEWLPTTGALRQVTDATYFETAESVLMTPPELVPGRPRRPAGWRGRLRAAADALRGVEPPAPQPRAAVNRVFQLLRPRVGENPIHGYPPGFGLATYDPRFRPPAAA
jgi:SAM-dependent methyltransferase